MSHDWVFEVLSDLATYAEANGLPRLARMAHEAEAVAREEIRALARDGAEEDEPSSG